jgi:hypothetical protein
MKEDQSSIHPERPTGPRGGTTTITVGGHIRKTLYLGPEEAERLRQDAFSQRRRESDVLREIVRRYYGLAEE